MHIDIPTRSELDALLAVEAPGCVTLYLPTSPLPQEAQGDRIALKNLVAAALDVMRRGGASAEDLAALEEPLGDLDEDYGFWSEQASSLAIFARPAAVVTYRLPNRLTEAMHVGDRFYIKPLLRAVSFPQAAFVLALAQGSVRLVEVAADVPADKIVIPEMPTDVASAVRKASIADRAPGGRVQGDEGQKVRMRQFARGVDRALRGVLAGRDLPLILASTPPLDAIFRSVNSYPRLAAEGIRGNPETMSDAELAEAARGVLDTLYAGELEQIRQTFEARGAQGRSATDLGDVARAARAGAVDTLLVDIDAHEAGTAEAGTTTDEIARLTLQAGGRVLAVRADDVPGQGPVAAILRYAA